MAKQTLLILGGTGEARRLAARLCARGGLRVVTSLAGRTSTPETLQGEVRVGGFGGAERLALYLEGEGIDLMVDATHPFAARMARNATEAARLTGVPLITLMRPAWQPVAGDNWQIASGMAEAATLLGPEPRRVFLAIGRQEVQMFRAAAQHHYLVRSVEPVEPAHLPPNARCILARGPFSEDDEIALLADHRIDIVVAKNSGGAATYGKIAAARRLGLPVIMIDRPKPADAAIVADVEEALAAIDAHLAAPLAERGA
ncbi:cobalt-precorrin-6A reductase [Nitratireductor kimnyeongensis]|uniref:Cobalt-precorrin-6A reductase n=1 Tax=Nitratireductor kimnyeongensis TaxID=430679 RepID=A0ABW0TEU6_9HYPH|nr:cobalt-precorrin-6A reductase [Nitratireductor kimnyeongensis]QZZ37595.1 cobalt-precorrin-6A reductase [Nitratireductor kimnyeongensis]